MHVIQLPAGEMKGNGHWVCGTLECHLYPHDLAVWAANPTQDNGSKGVVNLLDMMEQGSCRLTQVTNGIVMSSC